MWSTENSRFCEKYIEKQPKTSQKWLVFGCFLVEVAGLELAASSTRNWRATNCATPRFDDFYAIFCKWSNMWSDRGIDDFSTFGRAEKVSVCGGVSALLENSAPSVVIESRNWRATTCATPRYSTY